MRFDQQSLMQGATAAGDDVPLENPLSLISPVFSVEIGAFLPISNQFRSGRMMTLTERVDRDLETLGYGSDDWVHPRPNIDHDVVVVGAGQNGLAIGLALKLAGVQRVLLIDGAIKENVGVWRGAARMPTLRTSPAVAGPELGIASLSFRSWFDSVNSPGAFRQLVRIRRVDWADYLDWFSERVSIPTVYGCHLDAISPNEDASLVVEINDNGTRRRLRVRKLVLATGEAGSGEPTVPEMLKTFRQKGLCAHTDDPIDFGQLRGKSIAILGTGSSAFDAAAAALECGAHSVEMLCRRRALSSAKPTEAIRYLLNTDKFYSLPLQDKWRLLMLLRSRSAPPPPHSVERVVHDERFTLLLGFELDNAIEPCNGIVLTSRSKPYRYDFVVLGTGHTVAPAAIREISSLSEHIATWRDKVHNAEESHLLDYPYLGPSCEFTERSSGCCPALRNIHCFNAAGNVSFGRHFGEIQGISSLVSRLVAGITQDLFLDDKSEHVRRIAEESTAAPGSDSRFPDLAAAMSRRVILPL